jgi:hypothetical protein
MKNKINNLEVLRLRSVVIELLKNKKTLLQTTKEQTQTPLTFSPLTTMHTNKNNSILRKELLAGEAVYSGLNKVRRGDIIAKSSIDSILREQSKVLALTQVASLSSSPSHRSVNDSVSFEAPHKEEFTINKSILPFFSIPVILKKISDKKENNYLKLLNPQTKLVYKIIKLDTKLVEFTTSIKKYSFNLNSFKGNNLDFILLNKNNLYYNLKYRLSNILYKIEKFVPVFKLYSLLNNINLFSPKRLLKPQPYIRFSYRMRYITKINKVNAGFENRSNSTLSNEKSASSSAASQHWYNNKGNKHDIFVSKYPAHQILEINGRAINYFLVKLNNLVNEIEYLINFKNKFINLIKWLNFKNIKSRLEDSINDENNKKQKIKPIHSLNEKNVLPNLLEGSVNVNNRFSRTKDLYLQIIKDTGASLTENKIKIEKTIKSIYQEAKVNSKELSRWKEYLNSLQSNVNSNPVDILYFNNNLNRPIINQYLKSMSIYNMITKGTIMYYSKFIGFNLFSQTPSTSAIGLGSNSGEMQSNKLIKNIYKFLYSSFKSMYCLISKPVFIFKANKIVIQLFYFILIPNILKGKNRNKIYYYKKKTTNKKGNIDNIFKIKLNKSNVNNYSILRYKKKRINNKYLAKTN